MYFPEDQDSATLSSNHSDDIEENSPMFHHHGSEDVTRIISCGAPPPGYIEENTLPMIRKPSLSFDAPSDDVEENTSPMFHHHGSEDVTRIISCGAPPSWLYRGEHIAYD